MQRVSQLAVRRDADHFVVLIDVLQRQTTWQLACCAGVRRCLLLFFLQSESQGNEELTNCRQVRRQWESNGEV